MELIRSAAYKSLESVSLCRRCLLNLSAVSEDVEEVLKVVLEEVQVILEVLEALIRSLHALRTHACTWARV